MKKVIASLVILASVGLFSCNSQSKSSSEEVKNETVEVQSEQQVEEKQEEVETQPSAYCQTCGSEISGSPYEAFGRIYCDMQCYADDPTN
jgi:hypothetical protein